MLILQQCGFTQSYNKLAGLLCHSPLPTNWILPPEESLNDVQCQGSGLAAPPGRGAFTHTVLEFVNRKTGPFFLIDLFPLPFLGISIDSQIPVL